MATLDQKSPNVLLQSLCCRITGKSEGSNNQHQHSKRQASLIQKFRTPASLLFTLNPTRITNLINEGDEGQSLHVLLVCFFVKQAVLILIKFSSMFHWFNLKTHEIRVVFWIYVETSSQVFDLNRIFDLYVYFADKDALM